MKPVGILGGMGPGATVLLMQKVLAAVPANDDADHIPLIVHQNPQVPSRISALIDGTGTDPAPVLVQMARDLHNAGARALAMPCNTAHHYATAIANATPLPFLNMLDLTASHLGATDATRIGLLASPATRLTNVFDAPFSTHGLTMVTPDDDVALLDIIRAVKSGQAFQTLGTEFTKQAQHLIDQGAEHLLVACTELSLLTGYLPDDAPWSDSLDCLTSAIVEFALQSEPA